MKAQGALEYLIIVAAVLAIAAIAVLFLTGALKSTGGDISICKAAASNCAVQITTSELETIEINGETYEICDDSEEGSCYQDCVTDNGLDVLSGSTELIGWEYCIIGQPNEIYPRDPGTGINPPGGSPGLN